MRLTISGTLAVLFVSILSAGCALRAPEVAPLSDNPAVLSLLDQAKTNIAQNRPDNAGAELERALRIEPQNAALWSELARVRLLQWQPEQAANLAAKSNALAGNNRGLRAQNWRLIAQARTALGDNAGADDAMRRAADNEK